MSPAQTVLDAQTEALLQRLARERESRCRRTLDDATEQAQSIVARAYQDARLRVRQAVEEERRDLREALAARRAEVETRTLKQRQAAMTAALDRAWSQIESAMSARWENPDHRATWAQAAAKIAGAAFLDPAGVTLELDESLAEETAAGIAQLLAGRGLADVTARRVAGLGPGLRIRAGAVCVDASMSGLLRSRGRIEAELLAEFERLRSAHAEERV